MQQPQRIARTITIALLIAATAVAAKAPLNTFRATTPDGIYRELMQRNKRYADPNTAIRFPNLNGRRNATKDKQNPPVTILSCADSRVPPNLIFDSPVGDLFVVRVAGNVADPFEIASLEYAILHKYTKVIVVMGHSNCGAVDTAMGKDRNFPDAILALLKRIDDAIKPGMSLEEAIKANAVYTVHYLMDHSPTIATAVNKHDVKIVAAYYDLKSGKVTEIK